MRNVAFRNELAFCSNFYPAEVSYEGINYPTSEHAYQAAKSTNIQERLAISKLTAGEAKRAGKQIRNMRKDWSEVRVLVMEEIVRDKFYRHPELKDKLLATGGQHLAEENYWGDRFWGTVDGCGQNNLGKILMKVRDEMKKECPTCQGDQYLQPCKDCKSE